MHETLALAGVEESGTPDVIELLRARFPTTAPQEHVRHVTYFDTFDGRLRAGPST